VQHERLFVAAGQFAEAAGLPAAGCVLVQKANLDWPDALTPQAATARTGIHWPFLDRRFTVALG
jgi:hypothetical protein